MAVEQQMALDSFQDRVAVVTGASSGIGKAIAIQLVKKGMHVVGIARRLEIMEVPMLELQSPFTIQFHIIIQHLASHHSLLDTSRIFDSLTSATVTNATLPHNIISPIAKCLLCVINLNFRVG
ncbi:hypothetical protein PR048_033154 [Dryococelus australis]|uniref:Uncharacterized protein n=1 Tax=Dryococelus australis TaxID=614101 RepID=A0ABQ9G3P4_9NEOP|nr:hypothetical protein PR048_033154 [Dryococelus australis]